MKNSVISCSKNKIKRLYFAAFLLFVISVLWGICSGSTKIDLSEAFKAFSEGFNYSADTKILVFVRIPRIIAALFCGGALAVSGCIIQEVLGNK